MTLLTKQTIDQSIEMIAVQELENIYYPGYVQETDQEKVEWELKEFLSQFSKKK